MFTQSKALEREKHVRNRNRNRNYLNVTPVQLPSRAEQRANCFLGLACDRLIGSWVQRSVWGCWGGASMGWTNSVSVSITVWGCVRVVVLGRFFFFLAWPWLAHVIFSVKYFKAGPEKRCLRTLVYLLLIFVIVSRCAYAHECILVSFQSFIIVHEFTLFICNSMLVHVSKVIIHDSNTVIFWLRNTYILVYCYQVIFFFLNTHTVINF